MRLSVIIPVLNEAERIGELLATLHAWRAQGVEVIVADGGSRAIRDSHTYLRKAGATGREMLKGAAAACG